MQVFGICKGLRKNLKWMRGLITMINENEKKKKKQNTKKKKKTKQTAMIQNFQNGIEKS